MKTIAFFHPEKTYVHWYCGQDQDQKFLSFFQNTRTNERIDFKFHDSEESLEKDRQILIDAGWKKMEANLIHNQMNDWTL